MLTLRKVLKIALLLTGVLVSTTMLIIFVYLVIAGAALAFTIHWLVGVLALIAAVLLILLVIVPLANLDVHEKVIDRLSSWIDNE